VDGWVINNAIYVNTVSQHLSNFKLCVQRACNTLLMSTYFNFGEKNTFPPLKALKIRTHHSHISSHISRLNLEAVLKTPVMKACYTRV